MCVSAESHWHDNIYKHCLKETWTDVYLCCWKAFSHRVLICLQYSHQCLVAPKWLLPHCASFFLRYHLLFLDVVEILDRGCRVHSDGCSGLELWPGYSQRCHLVILSEQPPLRLALPSDELMYALADEVNHLADAHQDADGWGDHHEEGEDLLLSGTRYEAVHHVGARRQGALGQTGHVVTIVDVVQDVKKTGVEACFENQTHLWGDNWGLKWETHFLFIYFLIPEKLN